MMRKCFYILILAAVVSGGWGFGQPAARNHVISSRPKWARGVAVEGRLVPDTGAETDLQGLKLTGRELVCQDGKSKIYLLNTKTLKVNVYKPDGELYDSFVAPFELPTTGDRDAASAFSVDHWGDELALLIGAKVVTATRDQARQELQLPFLGTGLAFDGDDLIVSKVPVRFVRDKDGVHARVDPVMVARYDLDDGTSQPLVKFKGGQAKNPITSGLAHKMLIAVGQSHRIWVADASYHLRIRIFDKNGNPVRTWEDKKVATKVSFGHPTKEQKAELEGFTEEARKRVHYFHAPPVVVALDAHDGFGWVLIASGRLTNRPVLEVLSESYPMPVARLLVETKTDVSGAQMAVSDDYVWLFPRKQGTHPLRFDRFGDGLLVQMTQQWIENQQRLRRSVPSAQAPCKAQRR